MRKILLSLYKMMYFFIPIPLFFDFGALSFVYIDINEYDYITNNPLIPMPIGAISFFLAVIIGFICSISYSNLFKSVLSPSKILIFYSLVVFPLSVYAIFISNLSFPRLIQLILPMTFISLLSFPVSLKDRLSLLKITIFSGFIFYSFHFISIILTSNDMFSVDPNTEFSGIFGILIYQSLISYPAVMSLYLFLSMGIIYAARKDILPTLKKYKFVLYFFVVVLLYLLAASGRRAFLIEFISSFIIIVFFSFIYGFNKRYVSKLTLFYFIFFVFIFLSFFIFYINTPLSQRVLESISENTFDSGRVDILGKAFSFFSNNWSVLLVGGGGKGCTRFS